MSGGDWNPPPQVVAMARRSNDPGAKRRSWGWWALKSGHLATARKHARASLIKSPLSLDSWKLMYCAIRGH